MAEQWAQKVFCQEQEIKPGAFAYWLRKKRQSEEPIGGFVRVQIGEANNRTGVEVVYPYPPDQLHVEFTQPDA